MIGRYNGDAAPDLAVADYGPGYENGTVAILLGNGDGSFQPAQNFAAGVNPFGINQSDFNHDGYLDLAVPDNNGSWGIYILLGNGGGSFQPPVWYPLVGINPRGPAVGDFNGDGNLDLGVGTYQYPSGVSVLLGNGDGTFNGAVYYSAGEGLANDAAADMNQDGFLDLVTANSSSNTVSILLGNGDGTFGQPRDLSVGQNPNFLALDDLNNDGRADVAVTDNGGNAVTVLLGISCQNAGPPLASFSYSPTDPSRFDSVQFNDQSSDPAAGMAIVSRSWAFGDGAESTDANPAHQYAKDGTFQVKLTVKTEDGRSGSTTQPVVVATHDAAIDELTAPETAHAGQTGKVIAELENGPYKETVQVDLYRSSPMGFQLIDTKTVDLPAMKGDRTTDVTFRYTFTRDDAYVGKVSFEAIVTLVSAREALPSDNTAISPPTRISH